MRRYASRVGVFVGQLDHPDAKVIFEAIHPYLGSVNNKELTWIYTKDGREFRRNCEKNGILDYEVCFLLLKSMNICANSITKEELKNILSKILKGEFVYLSENLYGCKRSNIDRALCVIKENCEIL